MDDSLLRPSPRAWATEIGALAAVLATCLVLYTRVAAQPLVAVVGAAALIVMPLRSLALRREWVRVSGDGLAGVISDDTFGARWDEADAIAIRDDSPRRELHIALPKGVLRIPVDHFDAHALHSALRRHAPARLLAAEAWEHLAARERWREESRKYLEERTVPVIVPDSVFLRGMSWAGLLIFLGVAAVALSAGELWIGGPFAAIALLCLISVRGLGFTEFGVHGIARSTHGGRYFLSWSDVQEVLFGTHGDGIVFIAPGSQLSVPGPVYWASEDCERAKDALFAQIEHRGTRTRESFWAAFRRSRNTKVV